MPNQDVNAFGNNFAAKQTATKKPQNTKKKKINKKSIPERAVILVSFKRNTIFKIKAYLQMPFAITGHMSEDLWEYAVMVHFRTLGNKRKKGREIYWKAF